MENLFTKWMDEHGFSFIKVARLIKTDPSTVYRWMKRKSNPTSSHAYKLHRLTQGKVPITFWGYIIMPSGKIKKLRGSDERV